jgi:sec-independent protein translocase protein TatC
MLKVKHDFLPSVATLIAGGMADTIYTMTYLSFLLGLLFASPVILYEAFAFLMPALYPNEKKIIGYYISALIGLLILGFVMAYFLIIPVSFRLLIFFTIQGGAAPFIFIKDFYGWIFTLLALCAVFYTFPLLIVALVQVGVFPVKWLKGKYKLFLYLGILIAYWIFGPDPTPITGLIMMAPFVAVFELATLFSKRIDRARQKRKEGESNGLTPAVFKPFSKSMCKHCNAETVEGAAFCPNCNRSIR